ncbi:MAG TPA: hypothetical protein VN622_11210 [Clostridia bacterium]|nr:hypothetical protein [Clostridia bacterium]
MKFHLISALLIGFLACTMAFAADSNVCQKTSQAALRSCNRGAQSDYWQRVGTCDNIPGWGKRRQCNETAAAEAKDAFDECKSQLSGRQQACRRLGGEAYDPVIDPANFSTEIDNPYFPLKPGTIFIYEGKTPDGVEHNEVAVTRKTKVILGVTCVEVHDTVRVNGELTENTLDWYAQDKEGNVWYFGENSEELSEGLVVSLEGSWTAGVDGAKPGIIMEAHSVVGDFYRQEFSLGTAEDLAAVVGLDKTVSVPAGSFHHSLETEETTPLEPGAREHKFYAQGVGNTLTVDLVTGERLRLIQIKTE